MQNKIVLETKDFLVLDKAPCWLTVPSRWGERDERPCLGIWLQNERGEQLFPVHRLDFEVSGLVLFARNAQAHRVANLAFEGRKLHKFYEAWTEGSCSLAPGDRVEWRSKLLRGKKRAYESPAGKDSVTFAHFQGPARGELLAWLLEPLTGRPHQLRFELFKAGMPIAGDSLYGAKSPFEPGGIALRAVRLDLRASPLPTLPEELAIPGISSLFK